MYERYTYLFKIREKHSFIIVDVKSTYKIYKKIIVFTYGLLDKCL